MGEINWSDARRFIRERLASRLGGPGRPEIDDLTQEAAIRLLRASRQAEIREPAALMTTIVDRTLKDHIRRKRRWSLLVQPLTGDSIPDGAGPPDEPGDPQERVEFIVLEFFRNRGSECLKLAEAFFAHRTWRSVAESRGVSHAAIRKKWSRCCSVLRREAGRDRCLTVLADWAKV
jgi:hypothetical protein